MTKENRSPIDLILNGVRPQGSNTTEEKRSSTDLILIGARLMVNDPQAWRQRASIYHLIQKLKLLDTCYDEGSVVQREAVSLIDKLYGAMKKPDGVY